MTKQAERIQAAIEARKERLERMEEVENPDENDEILATEIEIKELESVICPECGGEGTITGSYFKSNPNLISPPEIDCPSCGGTGVM